MNLRLGSHVTLYFPFDHHTPLESVESQPLLLRCSLGLTVLSLHTATEISAVCCSLSVTCSRLCVGRFGLVGPKGCAEWCRGVILPKIA